MLPIILKLLLLPFLVIGVFVMIFGVGFFISCFFHRSATDKETVLQGISVVCFIAGLATTVFSALLWISIH